MKSVMTSLIAVAGLAAAVSAAPNTTMEFLASESGVAGTFAPTVSFLAGTGIHHVEFLVRVSYIPGSNGTLVPIGLGSLIFQPVVSGLRSTDTADAFANGGVGSNTSVPPGYVADAPGQFGRIIPFARTNLGTAQALTNFIRTGPGPATDPTPAGTTLRIAQRQVTAYIGGTGNTSGGSGVNIAQLNLQGNRVPADPAFNPNLLLVDIFRFGMEIDSGTLADGGRTLTATAPAAGFGNLNTDTGEREVYWYNGPTEATGSIRGTAIVGSALVNILVPTPGSLALLGLGGLVVGRRRR